MVETERKVQRKDKAKACQQSRASKIGIAKHAHYGRSDSACRDGFLNACIDDQANWAQKLDDVNFASLDSQGKREMDRERESEAPLCCNFCSVQFAELQMHHYCM